jgi:hypothetical protein
MALNIVRYSDFSGDPIPPGTGARIRVVFTDRNRTDRRADLSDAEVEQLLGYTKEVLKRHDRRGRYKVWEESD